MREAARPSGAAVKRPESAIRSHESRTRRHALWLALPVAWQSVSAVRCAKHPLEVGGRGMQTRLIWVPSPQGRLGRRPLMAVPAGWSFRVCWPSCTSLRPGHVPSLPLRWRSAPLLLGTGMGREERVLGTRWPSGLLSGALRPCQYAAAGHIMAATEIRNELASGAGCVPGHIQRRGDDGHEIPGPRRSPDAADLRWRRDPGRAWEARSIPALPRRPRRRPPQGRSQWRLWDHLDGLRRREAHARAEQPTVTPCKRERPGVVRQGSSSLDLSWSWPGGLRQRPRSCGR